MSRPHHTSSPWEFAALLLVLGVTAATGSIPLLVLVASIAAVFRARSMRARHSALVALWSAAAAVLWLSLVSLLALDSSLAYLAPVWAGSIVILAKAPKRRPRLSGRARSVFSNAPGGHLDGPRVVTGTKQRDGAIARTEAAPDPR
jgi:hypothetical protein